jgi:ribosomal protein S6
MGLEPLPYRMKSQGEHHYYGRYWLMHFYVAPSTIPLLQSRMRSSPDLIRHTILKLADGIKLDDLLHPYSVIASDTVQPPK